MRREYVMEIERASAQQCEQMKPLVVALMVDDLIDHGTDLTNEDDVILTLLSRRHSSRCIAACMDEAVQVAIAIRGIINEQDHHGRKSRHQESRASAGDHGGLS